MNYFITLFMAASLVAQAQPETPRERGLYFFHMDGHESVRTISSTDWIGDDLKSFSFNVDGKRLTLECEIEDVCRLHLVAPDKSRKTELAYTWRGEAARDIRSATWERTEQAGHAESNFEPRTRELAKGQVWPFSVRCGETEAAGTCNVFIHLTPNSL